MTAFLVSLFVAGICLACNEGYWFPWPNLVGILFIGIVVILANKMEDKNGVNYSS